MLWVIVQAVFYCVSLIATCVNTVSLRPEQLQEFNVSTSSSDEFTAVAATTVSTVKDLNQTVCIDDECNPRLVSNLEVHSYELKYIYKSFQDTTVQGHVTIDFTLKQPTRQLIYHAKRMFQLDEPALFENGVYRHITMRNYAPYDYVSLRLRSVNSSFAVNRYTLKQNFAVSLTDGHVGFYQSLYTDGGETVKYEYILSKIVRVLRRYFIHLENCWLQNFNQRMLVKHFLVLMNHT